MQKTPAHETNPQIVTLLPVDVDNIREWEAVVSKGDREDSRYYYGGQWKLKIAVPDTYPISPPKIAFDRRTPICHPNINMETGEICLDILKLENWLPAWNLQYLVVAILMLIDDPEPDSPLNIDLANLFRHDKVAFESVVQYYMWKFGTLLGEKDQMGLKLSARDLDVEKATYSSEVIASNAIHQIKDEAQTIVDETNAVLLNSTRDQEKSDLSDKLHETVIPDETQDEIKAKLNLKLNKIDSLKDQLNIPKSAGSTKSTVLPQAPNFKIIQDVGEQVTKQFMEKVNEISHSSNSSQSSLEKSIELQGVRQKVAENVTKQVEILCLKSTSPDTAEFSKTVKNHIPLSQDGEMEKIRENFMKQVDDKIKKHEEYIRQLHPNSPEQKDTLPDPTVTGYKPSVDASDSEGNSITLNISRPEPETTSGISPNPVDQPPKSRTVSKQPESASVPPENASLVSKQVLSKSPKQLPKLPLASSAFTNATSGTPQQPAPRVPLSTSNLHLNRQTEPSAQRSRTPETTAETVDDEETLQRTESGSSGKSSKSSSRSSFSNLRRSLSKKSPKTSQASFDDTEQTGTTKRKRLLSLLKSKATEK